MEYKYTQAHESYEMYAAGGVFYSAPGLTAFPVRLAVEIFRRCQAIRAAQGVQGPAVVYDPCCGGAYQLATLAYFNWDQIASIYGSDISGDALGVAVRNLSLLTLSGLAERVTQLASLYEEYGKQSHRTAHHHGLQLQRQLNLLLRQHVVSTKVFCADATDSQALASELGATSMIDIVFTDIPYGQRSNWHSSTAALIRGEDPVHQMLESLLPKLTPHAVVAIACAKGEKPEHHSYKHWHRLGIGNRKVVLLVKKG